MFSSSSSSIQSSFSLESASLLDVQNNFSEKTSSRDFYHEPYIAFGVSTLLHRPFLENKKQGDFARVWTHEPSFYNDHSRSNVNAKPLAHCLHQKHQSLSRNISREEGIWPVDVESRAPISSIDLFHGYYGYRPIIRNWTDAQLKGSVVWSDRVAQGEFTEVESSEKPQNFGNCLLLTSQSESGFSNDVNNYRVVFQRDSWLQSKRLRFPFDNKKHDDSDDFANDSEEPQQQQEESSSEINLHSRIQQITATHLPQHPDEDTGYVMARTSSHCSLLSCSSTYTLDELLRIDSLLNPTTTCLASNRSSARSYPPCFTISHGNSNVLHRIYPEMEVPIQSFKIDKLKFISFMEHVPTHPMILYSAASTKPRPPIRQDYTQLHNTQLHTIDFRSSSSHLTWHPSTAEHFMDAFSIEDILASPSNPNHVFVSSSSKRVHQVDIRMNRTVVQYSLGGIVHGRFGVKDGGALLDYCKFRDGREVLLSVPKSVPSGGISVYTPSSTSVEGLFETKSMLEVTKPSHVPSSDVGLQTFVTGMASFSVKWDRVCGGGVAFRNDLGGGNAEALCILTFTNVGEIYAHTLINEKEVGEGVVDAATVVGGCRRIPVPNSHKRETEKNIDSNDALCYRPSNEEPAPYYSLHKFHVLSKKDVCAFRTFSIPRCGTKRRHYYKALKQYQEFLKGEGGNTTETECNAPCTLYQDEMNASFVNNASDNADNIDHLEDAAIQIGFDPEEEVEEEEDDFDNWLDNAYTQPTPDIVPLHHMPTNQGVQIYIPHGNQRSSTTSSKPEKILISNKHISINRPNAGNIERNWDVTDEHGVAGIPFYEDSDDEFGNPKTDIKLESCSQFVKLWNGTERELGGMAEEEVGDSDDESDGEE